MDKAATTCTAISNKKKLNYVTCNENNDQAKKLLA